MKRDRFICIKDCTTGNAFIHYYFRQGQIYWIRSLDRSRYSYLEYTEGQDVGVNKDFLDNNFKIADTDSLLIAEVDYLFDSIFFER